MLLLFLSLALGQATPGTAPTPKDIKDPALRSELLRRMKAEQDVRMDLVRMNPVNKPITPKEREEPGMKAVLERMESIDRDNLAWLKGVVERQGWPGSSAVGRDGAQGAFLIVQHAVSDLEFMSKCLALLKEAYRVGEADGQSVALLTDRLLILKEKKQQLYGTQLMAKDGQLVPQPIEDEANVDARRKEMGMMPLADYLKMVNRGRGLPVKQPSQ